MCQAVGFTSKRRLSQTGVDPNYVALELGPIEDAIAHLLRKNLSLNSFFKLLLSSAMILFNLSIEPNLMGQMSVASYCLAKPPIISSKMSPSKPPTEGSAKPPRRSLTADESKMSDDDPHQTPSHYNKNTTN